MLNGLGAALRLRREELKLSSEQLAEKVALEPEILLAIETDKIDVDVLTLTHIADNLQTDCASLFEAADALGIGRKQPPFAKSGECDEPDV